MPTQWINVRMQLSGQYQTIAGLRATQAATAGLTAATNANALATHRASVKHWLWMQTLFTLRRVTYGATLAIGAAGVAAVGFGLKFNSSMEQNRVAFTHFLGDSQKANDYLDRLYELAARTPFEFQGLTEGTKKLLAFGFSADEAYRTMKDIGDASAGLGIGQEGIDRMSLAFGQMMTNGRILGGELRQLGEVGINARKYLQEAFQLTPKQMANIGALHIPSRLGIEAILRGLERDPMAGGFAGLAEAQGKTFRGQLSTLHDYAQKLFGQMTLPLFEKLEKDYLPVVVELSQTMQAGFKAGGWMGMIRAMDDTLNQGGKIVRIWTQLAAMGHDLWIIVQKELWPAFKNTAQVIGVLLIPVFVVLRVILKIMADHTTLFSNALKILMLYLLVTKTRAFMQGAEFVKLRAVYRAVASSVTFLIGRYRAFIIWTKMAQAANGQFISPARIGRTQRFFMMLRVQLLAAATGMKLYALAVWGAVRAMVMFLLTNPIGWAILLVIALTVLYFKWKWFHDKVDATFHFIKDHWFLLGAIILGPFFLIATAIGFLVGKIWGKVTGLWNEAKKVYNWIKDHLFGWLGIGNGEETNKTVGRPPPGSAQSRFGFGGGIGARATNVNPMDTSKVALGRSDTTVVHTRVELKGKAIAEAVSEHRNKREALR